MFWLIYTLKIAFTFKLLINDRPEMFRIYHQLNVNKLNSLYCNEFS